MQLALLIPMHKVAGAGEWIYNAFCGINQESIGNF